MKKKADTRRMGTQQQSEIDPKPSTSKMGQKETKGTGENPKQTNRPR